MRNETPETIPLRGGALCLDFANSVDWTEDGRHVRPEQTDVLTAPPLLARWGVRLGVLAGADAPAITRAELDRARALRDALHATFSAVAAGRAPAEGDVTLVGAAYAAATDAGRLTPGDRRWGLEWDAGDERRVRFAVVADAVALLGDERRVARLARCPGRECGWLFLNTSGRRRWCSMATCGSREKMRRMYARRQAA